MEIFKKNIHYSKVSFNVCRCCLSSNSSKNINFEYSDVETKPIFSNLLNETFGIELKYEESSMETNNVCDDCVKKLLEAHTFKIKVLDSESRLINHLQQLIHSVQSIEQNKYATIKSEENSDYDEDFHIEDVEAMNVEPLEDTEVIKEVKIEKEEKDEIFNKRSRPVSPIKKKRKKKEEVTVTEPDKTQKDWIKIAERRGNGPILRNDCLKILENSTICVFQWNKSRYRCFCCKEPFPDMNLLRQHTENTHTIKQIEKIIILQQNRPVKVEISTLVCKICSNTIDNLTQLKRHLAETHGINFGLINEDLLVPFKLETEGLKCQLCLEKFTVFRHLNIHMNKHYQNQVCHICGAGFSNLVFLNLHKTRSHRPFSCKPCGLNFTNRSEKKAHDVSIHNIKFEKNRFPCPFCDERFLQENLKVQHLVDKHDMIKPEFKCNICSKVYITKSLRNNHIKNVHLKEKNRECDICHMRFYTKSDVKRHRVTHTGEKNFACNLCTNLFATRDSLRRHVKRTHVVI